MIDKYKAREKVREEVNAEYDCDDVDKLKEELADQQFYVDELTKLLDNAYDEVRY